MPMQLKIDSPSEEMGEVEEEVISELLDQIKKRRIVLRKGKVARGERKSLDSINDWVEYLRNRKLISQCMKMKKMGTNQCKNPLTDSDAMSISQFLTMHKSKTEVHEALFDHYEDSESHDQIDTKTQLGQKFANIIRGARKITIYDRYLIRNTKAVITGGHSDFAGKNKKQVGLLLDLAQEVASENDREGESIEINIMSVSVTYDEWRRHQEDGDADSGEKGYKFWFNNESGQKRRDFACWLIEGNHPNLRVRVTDMADEKRYDPSEHDRFLHVEYAETWVSTGGFSMDVENKTGRLRPPTYMVRVKKPDNLGNTNQELLCQK